MIVEETEWRRQIESGMKSACTSPTVLGIAAMVIEISIYTIAEQ
jgi:hypothetical protein